MKTTVASVRKEFRAEMKKPESPPISYANKTAALSALNRVRDASIRKARLEMISPTIASTPGERKQELDRYLNRVLPERLFDIFTEIEQNKKKSRNVLALHNKINALLAGKHIGTALLAILNTFLVAVEAVHRIQGQGRPHRGGERASRKK